MCGLALGSRSGGALTEGLSEFAKTQLAQVEPGALLPFGPAAASGQDRSVLELCRCALLEPVAAQPLAAAARGVRSVAIIISDSSRDEPRSQLLRAVREQLPPRAEVTLVVASGTHSPSAEAVPPDHADLRLVVHDATRSSDFESLGVTARGTPIRISRALLQADLVVATGRLRPHYFAGFSAGAKAIFPGCGYKPDILQNHLLKARSEAALGRLDDNPCRLDLEEAALALPRAPYLLNVLCDAWGKPVDAQAGHLIAAHRKLAESARQLFEVPVPRGPHRVVVVSDQPPATTSLYQASKLLPPAGPLLAEGGTVVVLAECSAGVAPLERVNDGIYRLGMLPQLPERHQVLLVSELTRAQVAPAYPTWCPSLLDALQQLDVSPRSPAPLLCRGSELLVRVV